MALKVVALAFGLTAMALFLTGFAQLSAPCNDSLGVFDGMPVTGCVVQFGK